jgi:serine/threonine protein kinase
MLHVACALQFIDENSMCFLDLKIGNIVIHDKVAKLIDFAGIGYEHATCASYTLEYLPPGMFTSLLTRLESQSNILVYSSQWDVWAFGIVMILLLRGEENKPPSDSDRDVLLALIPTNTPKEVRKLVLSCLEV